LARIELAPFEHIAIRRIVKDGVAACGNARELTQKIGSPLRAKPRLLGTVVREVKERRRRREFLPLKNERRLGEEHEQRRERAVHTGTRQFVEPLAANRIRNLIVVLKEVHEAVGRITERRRAAPLLLPAVLLRLIQK